MINYLKQSFARKRARRVFKEYGYKIDTFQLETDGEIQFANWLNPLVNPIVISQVEIDFYKKCVPNGGLSIDIGANIGDTTVPMAIAAGNSGMVIALDPNPYIFKILEANAGLNKDKTNIVTLPYAATAKDGDYYYSSSEASFSNGGISEQQKIHGKHLMQDKVTGINLEAYLIKNYPDFIPKLSLIKVDTEGHDLTVLKTLKNLIEKYRPTIIAECYVDWNDMERFEMYEFISAFDYSLYKMEHVDIKNSKEIKSKKDMLTNSKANFNIYAVPNNQ